MLGGTQRLVQRAGVARAKEIAMLGRRHSPQAFERWGVINLVVPEEELGAVSLTWARQLAAGPTRILQGIKMLANESARAGIAAADRRQVEINGMIWATEDRKRGIEAFQRPGRVRPSIRETEMSAPLQGLRVVDFTRVLAGPHCTKALCDLGADVIKIEPPSGDIGRKGLPHIGDMGLYFVQQNAGKRNLSLDLNWKEAREIVAELCRHADIIVENFRPGTLARFDLSYQDVSAYNPNIVYVSITGYGQSTSWRGRPAFAPTVQCETGHTSIVHTHYGAAPDRADERRRKPRRRLYWASGRNCGAGRP